MLTGVLHHRVCNNLCTEWCTLLCTEDNKQYRLAINVLESGGWVRIGRMG